MIRIENLSKSFATKSVRKVIVENLTAEFPTGSSVALLGRNGAGKSTLLQLLAGTIRPDRGRVLSTGSISYPVGFAGSFSPDMTGLQNARFVARLYGVDTDELVDFVEDFAELGPHFNMPFRSYSSGMRSRLSFGVSMAIPFDTYLVDEVTSVGDGAFREKSMQVFERRRETSSAIVVTHSPRMVREICDSGAVLEGGKLHLYDDLETALEHHNRALRAPLKA
ncbi:capsular polysaccharide transport system ATP-binding protein [Octadecabacter temperatus]|uniref:Polysialic acid transport ATP-binding protein KpsT n=1 Tax=Octadecabacter temperatus TaxID=1458307 RepID=A0A0K0YAB6_9RHOB|nr:ABC transporter ATP-binding protein [Octadecabacter temperatus]AKS47837.1 Polysialic acid transport ATP-binding protein KpsT [Octadecabacter temperatus]SIO48261.1 capsular polysaccharide transport system ATP-binding protein [Octadecabacter temperatus]